MRGRRLVSLVLALTAVLSACGVPSDGRPRPLAANEVPFELLTPTSSTSTTDLRVAVEEILVHLVEGDHLVTVERQVLAPPVLFRRMTALLQGVQAEEAALGLRTAVPVDTRLRKVGVEQGVATINVSSDLVGAGGQEQVLAVAQLVFTATETSGVEGVRFQLEGRPIEVPRGDGTLTAAPLRRADFPALVESLEEAP